MNDCFWSWVGVCKGKCTCQNYRSVNEKEGEKLLELYDKDLEKAIAPVRDKWETIFKFDDQW